MAVILTDRELGVRRRSAPVVDAHGDRRSSPSWEPLAGPWPGRAAEGGDVPPGDTGARPWTLGVDPAGWPLERGDLVVDPGSGLEWLVVSARLIRNNASDAVDYVQVQASLREDGGTWP